MKNLYEERLTQLRKDITEQIHIANAPFMARGLIEIDQRICELLKEPYYTKYRHSVVCTDDDDESYIWKEHQVSYILKNPYGSKKIATEYINFNNFICIDSINYICSILIKQIMNKVRDIDE